MEALKKAKIAAYRRLSGRAYTTLEMRQYLEKSLFPEEIISQLLEELTLLGMLDDREWLTRAIHTLISRGKSLTYTLFKLQPKGFTRQEITDVWEAAGGRESLTKAVEKERSRLIRRGASLEDYPTRQKLIASLCRKGFSYETVRSALES